MGPAVGSGISSSFSSFTVTDVAERIRESVSVLDAGSVELLESLLQAVGFRWTDDYSDSFWVEGAAQLFEVGTNFPSIAPPDLRSGVSRVQALIERCGADSVGEEDGDGALSQVLEAHAGKSSARGVSRRRQSGFAPVHRIDPAAVRQSPSDALKKRSS